MGGRHNGPPKTAPTSWRGRYVVWEEAAEILGGCSRSTIDRMARDGVIRRRKHMGRSWFNVADCQKEARRALAR